VTALYEVVPTAAHTTGDLMTVKLRYKLPTSNTSKPLDIQVRDRQTPIASASADFRFAAAVASFGMLLRQSPNKGDSSYASVVELAEGAIGDSTDAASRREFVGLAKTAQRLGGR
jgi:Ca-activated chloride channel family protein